MYFVFFFKQKTAYEMRISDWSSDVCSSDLVFDAIDHEALRVAAQRAEHAHGDNDRHHELHDRHAQVADAGVHAGGEAFFLFGEEKADVGHAEIGRASCRERVCQYV